VDLGADERAAGVVEDAHSTRVRGIDRVVVADELVDQGVGAGCSRVAGGAAIERAEHAERRAAYVSVPQHSDEAPATGGVDAGRVREAVVGGVQITPVRGDGEEGE